MPRSEYVAEHQRLIDVLRHPTPARLRSEAKAQGKDLRKVQ